MKSGCVIHGDQEKLKGFGGGGGGGPVAAAGGGAEHGDALEILQDLGLPGFWTDLKRSKVKLKFVGHLEALAQVIGYC